MTFFFRKHKKKLLGALSILLLIVLLFCANALTIFVLPTQTIANAIESNTFEVFLISLAKSQVKNESISRAEDFQKIGAGGFVWEYEDYYHVVSSAYLNKSDALLVQNSIKLNQNIDSQLLTITFDSIKLNGNFDEQEYKVVSNLLFSPINFYTCLYDIAVSLDTKVFDQTNAKLAVNTAQHTFSTTLANFNTLYPKPHPDDLSLIYNICLEAYSTGEKLCREEKISDEQNYSSLLKYRYLEVLNI